MSLKYRVVPIYGIYGKWALQKNVWFWWILVKYYYYKEIALEDLERLNTDPIYYVPKGK